MAIHAACDPGQLFVMEMVITRQRGSISTVHRKKQKLYRFDLLHSLSRTVYSRLNQLSEGLLICSYYDETCQCFQLKIFLVIKGLTFL
jgi:hypothetical protein